MDHAYSIPIKLHQNPSSGSWGEVENVNCLTDGRRVISICHLSLRLLCPKKRLKVSEISKWMNSKITYKTKRNDFCNVFFFFAGDKLRSSSCYIGHCDGVLQIKKHWTLQILWLYNHEKWDFYKNINFYLYFIFHDDNSWKIKYK